jgi:hypothetical protein
MTDIQDITQKMANTKISVPDEVRFYTNSKILLSAIREGFENLNKAGYQKVTTAQIEYGIIVFDAFDKHYIIQRFIKFSHPYWDQILNKNERFFTENSSEIFKELSSERLGIFNELFTLKDKQGRNLVGDDLKDQIWDLFHHLVKCSIKYIHNKRLPYHHEGNNFYETEFLLIDRLAYKNPDGSIITNICDVEIDKHAKTWNVKLIFPPV